MGSKVLRWLRRSIGVGSAECPRFSLVFERAVPSDSDRNLGAPCITTRYTPPSLRIKYFDALMANSF